MRCDRQREALDPMGHSELRQGRADAGHGYRPWRITGALPQCEGRCVQMNFAQIAEVVLNTSEAEETEVVAMEQDESLTRFANNCVHQNVTERNVQITVRAVAGTKIGIAISNDTRPDRLRQLAARAHAVAMLQPDNPEFKGLPEPQPIV